MIQGLYRAASGMLIQQTTSDATAHNLANVSTVGYRRQVTSVNAFSDLVNDQLLAEASTPRWLATRSATDTADGTLRPTGNNTDIALRGDGFFTLQSPTGDLAYTRNGAFTLNADHQLSTPDGWLVLGERGPITLDAPNWEIDHSGQVVADGATLDRLQVVRFAANDGNRLGDTRWTAGEVLPATNVQVESGYLESSNVNAITEMVALITATRSFEANQRCVQAIDATLDRAVNDIARV